MAKILWKPKNIQKTHMFNFMNYINRSYGLQLNSYQELHQWSVKNIPDFWKEIWAQSKIIHSKQYDNVIDDMQKMPGAKWFSGARLNFAENLLRFRNNQIAIYAIAENMPLRTLTYNELFQEVEALTHSLKSCGLKKGDRVVGFISNIPEAVVAMLATSALGAIWSSASPDFGVKGALDRFKQIDPKIVFASNGYYYNGKKFDLTEKLNSIIEKLPSINQTVIIDLLKINRKEGLSFDFVYYDDFLSTSPSRLKFEQVPFNYPLYIMYSSGTTGLPKSIVHSAGGTFIQHWKELYLHCNLTKKDTIFYFTTCGWMMWNWLVSALSIGSSIVLFDGAPFFPNNKFLWKIANQLGVNIFGTSAKYIDSCQKSGLKPNKFYKLPKLKTILSTGSPLSNENFKYVYENIKSDVLLGSISGGTDIISCFALANPILPVQEGELQSRGLGMDIHALNENGEKVIDQKGELVCSSIFPSMPIYFWDDKDNKKYKNTYFNVFKKVWHHGDYIRISKSGSLKIFGRSDATLNPGGVRIGTSEIYNVVEKVDEISDSLVIGQSWNGDQRILLFLKMEKDQPFNETIVKKVKNLIKTECSPRHVPEIVIETEEIPYTINGKKVEITVKRIIEGMSINNTESLQNPKALIHYEDIPELKH
tara:strand:+ start:601 stop:2544 length:1944 start_codon:yes stop_codon:yes gene_type:complete